MKTRKAPSWLWIALSAVISAILFTTLLVVNATVPSGSMEPTLRAGQQVLGWRQAYGGGAPKRGDIVLFHHAALTDKLLVKRVVAVAGDVVELRHGTVYLNGAALDEPYVQSAGETVLAPLTVPAECCFVLGDNRAASVDSSQWDDPFVRWNEIVAQVILIYG